MNEPPRSTVIAGGRSRSTLVAWLALIAGAAGLGLLGQGRGVPADPSATAAARASDRSATVVAPTSPRAPARASATRPPIGEDGVMGGLVFGTAWRWLDEEDGD